MTLSIANILLLLILSVWGSRFLKSEFPSYIYWGALVLKLTAGIILGLIYFEYYGAGDTIHFFESAKNNTVVKNQPRTQFFISVIRPIVVFSGKSYWISSLWLSFISFSATWFSAITISKLYPKLKVVILISLLFIPSVVFWSSGIMKDTVVFAALAIFVSQVLTVYRHSSISFKNVILISASALVLFQLKHYLLISALLFGGVLGSSFIYQRFTGLWKWITSFSIVAITLFSTQVIHPYLNINKLPWVLHQNNQSIVEKTENLNRLGVIIKDPSWEAVISQVPKALHIGLTRPDFTDITPAWGYLHKLENFILTILIVMSILLLFKLKRSIDKPILIASCLSILLLAIMLPLSTPNLGTLIRYKNGYLPYLFLICSVLPYRYLTSNSND